jgi:hypothetical protein
VIKYFESLTGPCSRKFCENRWRVRARIPKELGIYLRERLDVALLGRLGLELLLSKDGIEGLIQFDMNFDGG